MEFTIVKAVPLFSEGALWATKVEKSGESMITAIPQTNRKIKINWLLAEFKTKTESRQQTAEINSAKKAIRLAPNLSER